MLVGHVVKEATAQGWDTLSNGALLTEAETAGFDVLVTPDKNIRHQQPAPPASFDPRRLPG